jgi:hypothetical protein
MVVCLDGLLLELPLGLGYGGLPLANLQPVLPSDIFLLINTLLVVIILIIFS